MSKGVKGGKVDNIWLLLRFNLFKGGKVDNILLYFS
jgi:hypothetical protein